MPVTVIIRSRNSEVGLKRCIDTIHAQSIRPEEIIVVDSGSEDNSLAIAKETKCQFIHYPINEISFNYSKALNLGIKQATGEYLLIISSHVWLPNKNSVKWMLDKLNEDASFKAVSLSRSNEQDKLNADIQIPFGKTINKQNFKGEGMYNYCSIIRKSDWEKYNFREDIPTCEDQDWIWHWMKTENASSFIFQFPLAGYDNPNYNLAKDIQEVYTCGTYIYPPYMSFRNIFGYYGKSLRFLFNKKLKKANHHFWLGTALLKYKFIPPRNLQSDTYLSKYK
jgi:glycosyltransferase involved in cell wall biosynthesis